MNQLDIAYLCSWYDKQDIIQIFQHMNQNRVIANVILRIKINKMLINWKKRVKKSKHRFHVLKQWYETELTYIKDIEFIQENIQKPLLKKQLITHQEDRVLFPNLDSILQLSHQIVRQFEQFMKNWHPNQTMIGEHLLAFYKGFIIYSQYCNNYYKGEKIIKSIKNQKQFKKIESKLSMDIESYLIKPVQRPPKYKILLREYQKVLREDHPDYEILTQAINKYHEVIEQNNQSMDEQIRNHKKTELDSKFGGIIVNASRQYLFEEEAKSIDYKVKLYVFNDMILVVKLMNDDREQGFKKIFLDSKSFVDAPMDGKYFLNKLFICGEKRNLHLNFYTNSAREEMYKKITHIINRIHQRQLNRQSVKRKTKIKMNVLKFEDVKIKTQPQLRITVVGVEKRPVSKIEAETVYILKIQAPFPNNTFQYSYKTFDSLISLQNSIRSNPKYKNMIIPLLNDAPETMGYYDVKKNKTKIIQYRQIYIQRYLNFIIRSEQLEAELPRIVHELKINQQFWEVVSCAEPCTCDICIYPNNQLEFNKYQEEKMQLRSVIFSNLQRLSNPQRVRESYYSGQSRRSTIQSSFCLFDSFLRSSKYVNIPSEQLDTLARRLMWVDCKMGRIDYLLAAQQNEIKDKKVAINFLSLKPDEKTYVWISSETKVYEIMEEIAESYNLKTLRDFGLFIDYRQCTRMIDRDEKLWEIIQNQYKDFQVNEDSPERTDKNTSSFWNKMSSLKKWGENILGSKKIKIYLKKYIFLDDKLQIKACEENPERYPILIEEAFYRFKHQILILNSQDIKKFCALYYILTNIDRISMLTESNFQVEKLRALIPEEKWKTYNQFSYFQRDVFFHIKKYWDEVEEHLQDRYQSKIFNRLEHIYNAIIKLVHHVIGWNTLFFDVTNYDPPTLPGSEANLLLGINRHNLVIIRKNQITPLIEIPIKKLDYKITVFSIFIETSEKILRFDGQMMYGIKKILEIYKNLGEKFN